MIYDHIYTFIQRQGLKSLKKLIVSSLYLDGVGVADLWPYIPFVLIVGHRTWMVCELLTYDHIYPLFWL